MIHNKKVRVAKRKNDMVRASYYLSIRLKRLGEWAYQQSSKGLAVNFNF